MSASFQFKQFTVQQDRCAMKIGTDGILLGAWTSLEDNPTTILDIGAGTGLISLQLAQRTAVADIEAVEIDEQAYEQCVENFENAPWNDRLFCYHASIQEFASEMDMKYDLIVSNPPFYREDYTSNNAARDRARFEESMPFEHLIVCVDHLLSDLGSFSMIIPKKEESHVLNLGEKNRLFPFRICEVQGNPDVTVKRSLIQFGRDHTSPVEYSELVIEKRRHDYTDAYRSLVKDFYLKM